MYFHSMDNSSKYLKALRLIQEDQWHKSHDIIEQIQTRTAARIHALLHRIEGDQWNADYWYSRAGLKRPDLTTDQECAVIIEELTSDIV